MKKTLVEIVTTLALVGGVETALAQYFVPPLYVSPPLTLIQPDGCVITVWPRTCPPQPKSLLDLILTSHSSCRPYIEFSKECSHETRSFFDEHRPKSFVNQLKSGINTIVSGMYKEAKLYFMKNGKK